MKITIIGAGYVGLVTAGIFSDFGHKVYCIDIDKEKIENLKAAKLPFFEPGLDDLIKRNLERRRLFFTTSHEVAIPSSKVIFICVGTPPLGDGEVDLTQLYSAVKETAKHLKGYSLIAIKSTVPIGVEEDIEKIIKKFSKSKFELASCPEFLREGSAIADSRRPDRIVIGTKSKKAADILLDLHKHISGERIICDLRSAQLIKYVANSFLATKVSFANSVANLSEKVGAEADTVLWGAGLDRRVGHTYLSPGVGYGGSCLPKDVLAFVDMAKKYGFNFKLLKAVDEINENQIDNFVEKIRKSLNNQVKGKIITILGLSFKPNTDDMREAPSVKIINRLLSQGAKIKAYDPVATKNAKNYLKDVIFTSNAYEAAVGSSALCIVTEWNEFKELDLAKISKIMKKPIILDGRNIYNHKKIKEAGFIYMGMGRRNADIS